MNLLAASLTAMMIANSTAHAAEGLAPAWTDVAPADRLLMGDYEGEWLNAPKDHYFDINKPLAAQVINIREGEYQLRFFQQHDSRSDPYFEGPGKLVDGEIRSTMAAGSGWNYVVSKDGLSGSGQGYGGDPVKFQLKRVTRSSPTLGAKPPQGAIVLFDGDDLDEWQHTDGRPATWNLLGNGAMEVRCASTADNRQKGIGGDIVTKRKFGDCTVHLEFRYPVESGKSGQGRGNSGFFLQDCYEVQVLNSYGLHGYWNECGALYKACPPQVNAARPPMEWQTYDIDFTAAVWKDGRKVKAPRITVRHNGVVIHKDYEIPHATAHAFAARGDEPQGPGPLRLQDHNNEIQFRNIWISPRGAK